MPRGTAMEKWNHYICPDCGGTTIARHDNEGVTPFLLRCRVKDLVDTNGNRFHGCEGMAESAMFMCSQADDQIPHVVFYRPDAAQAIADINKEPKRWRVAMLEHYQKGGSLLREEHP